jgi:hypothetical protein
MKMSNRTARALLLLASAMSLTACSWVKSTVAGPAEPIHMITPYFEDDFRFWKGTGSASLTGEASYKSDDGRVVTCQTVTLMPATQYNMELEQFFGKGVGYPPDYSKQAHVYNREAACDPTGRFRFEKIPYNVKWIVVSRLTWREMAEESTLSSITSVVTDIVADEAKGGYIYRELPLHEGNNTVVLSNADFVKDR